MKKPNGFLRSRRRGGGGGFAGGQQLAKGCTHIVKKKKVLVVYICVCVVCVFFFLWTGWMDRGGICVLEHAKPSMTTSFPRSTTIGVYILYTIYFSFLSN